ncbi:hypothetical protein DLM45_03540 [Hyphomicrobium methylovorum]|uniref:hypothetical protein n=1 Tax=Hyphomicrobium methylovorum TaxID=84 RepID=UPI0015E77119|nr:hypothetical protein [Hyphomicrobium methylovorum]MBA2125296.1 hypothetical protein [Hyphomicrobium methylovorum]
MRVVLIAFLVLFSGPALADADCKKKVDTAFEKLRESKAFRLETKITSPQGSLDMKVDYVLPDRMHQTVLLGKDATPLEMIVVGKKAWSNQGQGWAELPENFAETVAKQIRESVAESPKGATDYKCVGEKDFEGKSYEVFEGVLATPLSADAKEKGPRVTAVAVPNQNSVYVDKATGLPVRNIVTPVTEPDKRLFDGTFTILHDAKIDAPQVAEAPAPPAAAPPVVPN